MKNTKKCIKCGSGDILLVVDKKMLDWQGNSIYTGWRSHVNVQRFVCCGCGYTEEWIQKSDIPTLKEAYGN